MPFIDLPARAVLKLRGQTEIAWAVFDPDWYVSRHPDIIAELGDAAPARVLAWYLEHGQAAGHSPNIFFDESWHRQAYPAVAVGIASGACESAFDSYCRGGGDRAPHWLFEEFPYRRRHPDLTDAALQAGGFANGYDHFLRDGDREGRVGHLLFDARFYLAQIAEAEQREAAGRGPFLHYLSGLWSGAPEARTSWYFDPDWYRDRYPEAAEHLAEGRYLSALHHYLVNPKPTAFDPLPAFSEEFYRARYPDLVPAIEQGMFRNGYAHFLRYGIREFRFPGDDVDLRYYSSLPAVKADLARGLAPDAFAHWATIGSVQGWKAALPQEERISEAQAKALFRRKAALLTPLFGWVRLYFQSERQAAVTAIVVVHNQFELTMMALASLQGNYPGDIALVLVDSGSADETRSIRRYVEGATIIRFEDNVGYLRGCNAALEAVSTDAVLLMNNDVELAAGALPLSLERLKGDPTIGAVGGKVVRTHGLLQEAGCIIWRDGSTKGYLRDESPLTPEANFVRDVDFCSALFLLVRTDLLRRLGGFDEAFAPAYYEDSDLCVRIWQAGHRVVYDPAVMIHHLEYGSADSESEPGTRIALRHETFTRRHEAWLSKQPQESGPAQLVARLADRNRKRVLFIEDQLPLRAIGSGFVRSNDIIQTMAALGYAIAVFPLHKSQFELAAVYADMPDTAEVMHDQSLDQLEEFLLRRAGYFDAIWVARTHNLGRIRPMLDRLARELPLPPLILDSEAITSVRQVQAIGPGGGETDLMAAIRAEFAEAATCSAVIAVNETEADLLRSAGVCEPVVLGHMRRPEPTPRPFGQRAGMLFVGAIHRMDSPNYDSLCWFVDEVLPRVEEALLWETRLTVAGFLGAEVTLDRFADHPRVTLRGELENTAPLYGSHRLFVAPTRIAAGTPYKVHEAASFGVPVVATELLRSQLGWRAGEDMLVADQTDAKGFAAEVVRLYRDEALWQRLRENALARIATETGSDSYGDGIASLLGPVIVDRPQAV